MAGKSPKSLAGFSCALFFLLGNLHGEIINRKHLLFHFDKVEISGEISVFIEPGKRNREMEIFADQEIIDSVGFRVSNRTLFIEANNTYTFKRRIPFIGLSATRSFPVEISINIESLKEVSVRGKSSLSLHGIESESFQFNFESTGNAHINEMKSPDLKIMHRGAGDVSLRGSKVDMLELKISGTGNLAAEELFIDQAKVIHTGRGLVTLAPNIWLDAKILGTGNIRLLEKPDGMVLHREENAGHLIQEYEYKEED